MNNKIQNRQAKEKQTLIDQLKKTPIVQIACEKSSVGRATYYRWHLDDSDFAQKADEALAEGSLLINDMAESQLMSAIRDKNLTAITYWLNHHHPSYATRVEVTAHLRSQNETLTPEQEALVNKALQLASLIPTINKLEEKKEESK